MQGNSIDEICSRLQARDDRIMSMSIAQIVDTYQHDKENLIKILELRESIVRARAQGLC